MGNLLIRQWGEKACILHDGISRQKETPNWPTSANIPVFKKRTRASKNNYGRFNILPVLSKLFEKLFSKQLVKCFERILLIEISMQLYNKKGYGPQHCLQMMLETWKKKTDNKK